MTYAYKLATDDGFRNVLASGSGLAVPMAYADKLEPGTYYLKVTATNESGYTTDCFDYSVTENNGKNYGCYVFAVGQDGTISYVAGEVA